MRKKICFVVAIPGSAHSFLKDHIGALSEYYDIYLVGNINSESEVENLAIKDWKHIDINRNISLKNDIKALFQLRKYFKLMKFDAVHSVTPKAGLINSLAGYFSGIPNRIHIFTGQVWATKKGFSRKLLKSIDKLISRLNTHILVDGKSQQKFLILEGVLKKAKSQVLGEGSICGVNTERFNPSLEIRNDVRKHLSIPDYKIVFVFMGRLNHDKGLYELLPAFNRLAENNKNVFLLIFGRDEENIESTFDQYKNLNKSNFLYYGLTSEPGKMLQAGDIFVLPTYREGFGSSVIEAACLGLPTITSDAYGVLDASIPGVTGLQCKVGDIDSLYSAMKELADNESMRCEMGRNGRQRVLNCFSGDALVKEWIKFYRSILG